MAFDKTGTVTVGKPRVVATLGFNSTKPDRVLALAAGVERLSEHHLGRAIVAEAATRKMQVPTASGLRNQRGLGAVADIEGRQVAVGQRGSNWLRSYITLLIC